MIHKIDAHSMIINDLSISADGLFAVTSSRDKTVKVGLFRSIFMGLGLEFERYVVG